jgi:hypothetical protein
LSALELVIDGRPRSPSVRMALGEGPNVRAWSEL